MAMAQEVSQLQKGMTPTGSSRYRGTELDASGTLSGADFHSRPTSENSLHPQTYDSVKDTPGAKSVEAVGNMNVPVLDGRAFRHRASDSGISHSGHAGVHQQIHRVSGAHPLKCLYQRG